MNSNHMIKWRLSPYADAKVIKDYLLGFLHLFNPHKKEIYKNQILSTEDNSDFEKIRVSMGTELGFQPSELFA